MRAALNPTTNNAAISAFPAKTDGNERAAEPISNVDSRALLGGAGRFLSSNGQDAGAHNQDDAYCRF